MIYIKRAAYKAALFYCNTFANRVIMRETIVSDKPTTTTPSHCIICQNVPARNVPNAPPTKYVVIKIVFTLFEALGREVST